jgi:hypothetical protein
MPIGEIETYEEKVETVIKGSVMNSNLKHKATCRKDKVKEGVNNNLKPVPIDVEKGKEISF